MIYSPSATTTFARCPQLWQFYREGWQPKHIGRLQISGAYGIGFAEAMETLFEQHPWTTEVVDHAISNGIAAAERNIYKHFEAGGVIGHDGQNLNLIQNV